MSKKLTIELAEQQHQALKVHAAVQQTTIRQIVTDAIDQHMLKSGAHLIDQHIDTDMLVGTDSVATELS